MENNLQEKAKGNNMMGYVILLISSFLYSCQTPLSELAIRNGVHSGDVGSSILILAAISINIYLLVTGKTRETFASVIKYWKWFLILGVVYFGGSVLLVVAVGYISANLASLIMFSAPLWIGIFFMVTKIKRMGLLNKIAMVGVIIGAALVLDVVTGGIGKLAPVGLVIAFLASFFYAGETVIQDLKFQELDAVTVLTGMLTVAAVSASIVNPGVYVTWFEIGGANFGILLFIGVVTKVFALLLYVIGIKHIGSEKACIVMTTELPMTLLISYVLLSATMNAFQLLGVAIIVVSIILLQREK